MAIKLVRSQKQFAPDLAAHQTRASPSVSSALLMCSNSSFTSSTTTRRWRRSSDSSTGAPFDGRRASSPVSRCASLGVPRAYQHALDEARAATADTGFFG